MISSFSPSSQHISQNIKLFHQQNIIGFSYLGIIPINDLMWAITLNITWIYLFSVSVFLSLFLLLSPQNLLTLVSYSSNFCIPPPKKICLFSFQQPGDNSLAQRVPYVYISQAPLYCMSILYCPSLQTLSFKYLIFLLWMYSPWKPSVTISALFSPLSLILSLLF